MTFLDMLRGAERQNRSLLCVGLDPDPARFPAKLKGDAGRIYDFCAAIVDATADTAIAFKPQIAYFAAHRAEDQLERLMEHMRRTAPQVPTTRTCPECLSEGHLPEAHYCLHCGAHLSPWQREGA
mgnify:CR=1 FL=1